MKQKIDVTDKQIKFAKLAHYYVREGLTVVEYDKMYLYILEDPDLMGYLQTEATLYDMIQEADGKIPFS